MNKINRKVLKRTPQIRYMHMMEIKLITPINFGKLKKAELNG
jgi:hypothetical protein